MRARLIRVTTALAVLVVASVAAIISCQRACELVAPHGETGPMSPIQLCRGGLGWFGA